MQQKEQPKERSRPTRGRGPNEGWNDTNWDSVSDEDYWAELSSDKPLASRTAQSAADLRSPDPEPKKQRDGLREPKLAQPVPQAATLAMPEFSPTRLESTDVADHRIAALPVRRSGSTTGPMSAVPATARPASGAGTDYADPNLALLASLSEPAAERREGRATGWNSAPAQQPGTPPGGWPATGPGQREWSQPRQEYASAAGNPTSYHAAPTETTGAPSYGMAQHATGYGSETPGHGIPARPGYPARTSYDTGPNTPAVGLPPATYGTTHSAGADQMTGPSSVPADMTGTSYNGSHVIGSYDRASYGAPSHPVDSPATAPHAAPYATGSYGNSYAAGAGSHATPPTGWLPQDAATGRSAEGGWKHGGQAGIGGPVSAMPPGGYGGPLPNSYPGALPADVPGTPAGGIARVQATDPGNVGQPTAPGYPSGYLSSSALSARHGMSEPDQFSGPDSGNPYGSYVTGPANPPRSGPNGTDPDRQPRHRDTTGYDAQHPYGGYGGYGGGARS